MTAPEPGAEGTGAARPDGAARRFDPTRVLGFAGHDASFIRELAGVLKQSAGRQLTGLRLALRQGDRAAFARQAHQLRGGLGTFGDPAINDRAAALEEETRGESQSALETRVAALEADVAWLGQALEALAGELEAAQD